MPDDAEPQPQGQILIYAQGESEVAVRLDGETVWLSQKLMAELYGVSVKTVNEHLVNIYESEELPPEATIRKFRIVQMEGSREVARLIEHYSLDAIIAVGYRVRSTRGSDFRRWATGRLSELLVKGFTLDDERIKAGRTLGAHYFDELLERIRDIRASERLFYQKITDIYATAIDYDANAQTTRDFFANVQNKLHWAIHGNTAAELLAERADASKPNMGLRTWKSAPSGPPRKGDARVAKNYLTQEELRKLNRVVTMYLDFAEDQAERQKPMSMQEWAAKLDSFIQFTGREVLTHLGKISRELALEKADGEFERFNAERRRIRDSEPSDFDRAIAEIKRLKRDED